MDDSKRIRTKDQLKEYLDVEMADYRVTNPRQLVARVFLTSERAILGKHIKLLRTTEYHVNTGHKLRALWYNARLMKFQIRYGMRIPVNSCGKGLSIAHAAPCGVTAGTSVGENFRLHMLAWAVGDGTDEGVPTIGDDVILGVGAKIVGKVTVADHISIGANSVVTKDFLEPNCTIAGVPARKLKNTSVFF